MFTLNCKGTLLVIDQPVVMGIINATPDSFYEGSRFTGVDALLKQAEKMLKEGAVLLDIGGQSTRPGNAPAGAEEELRRIIPAIESLHFNFPEVVISTDTYHAIVAKEAINAGAGIINDISGGSFDEAMLATVAALHVPFVCMHIKGDPASMHKDPSYKNVMLEVTDYFIEKTNTCKKAGIKDVIIDPGFGFSKNVEHNFRLLHQLQGLSIFRKPVMVGLSRKSTIWRTLNISPDEALNGTTVLNTLALMQGASILRVHDVKEAVEAVKLVSTLKKITTLPE